MVSALLKERKTAGIIAFTAAGCAWFAWEVAGALLWGTALRLGAAFLFMAALIAIWPLEARIFSRLLKLDYAEAAGKIASSWHALIVLPFSALYFNGLIRTAFLKQDPSAARVAALALFITGVAVAGSICLKVLLLWRHSGAMLAALEERAEKIIWGTAAVYFLVFAALAFVAYSRFKYHSDLGEYNQTLWATLNGRFFYTTVEETAQNYLGTHISPFLLLLLPVYSLFQSPLLILFLRSLALALAAVPMFYCIRRLSGSGVAALLLSLAFLFHPEIVSQHFTSGYEVVFAAGFFLTAFYFFTRGRFGLFMLFLVLTLSVREDMVPVAFVFFVYALIKRRQVKWVLAPLALGVVWQVAVILIFNAVIENWVFNLYFGHFGSSPAEMIKTVFFHPVYAIEETVRLHRSFLYNLLMPEAFILPWTGLASLFALPNLATSLARGQDFSAAAGGVSHYSVIVVSSLWLGLTGYIKRAQRRYSDSRREGVAAFVAVMIVVLVASAAHLWAYYLPVREPREAAALTAAIELIPADASVSTNDGRVIPRLSSRWEIYEPLVWDVIEEPERLPQGTEQLKLAEFVILKPFGHPLYNDEAAFSFVTGPGSPYRLIFEQDGIRVYQRVLLGVTCPLPAVEEGAGGGNPVTDAVPGGVPGASLLIPTVEGQAANGSR